MSTKNNKEISPLQEARMNTPYTDIDGKCHKWMGREYVAEIFENEFNVNNDVSTIYAHEKGTRNVPKYKLEIYSKIYGVSVEYLEGKTSLTEPNINVLIPKDNEYTISAKKVIEIMELLSDEPVQFYYQLLFPSKSMKKQFYEDNLKQLNEAVEFMESRGESKENIEKYKNNYDLTSATFITTYDNLVEFNFDPICKVKHKNRILECVLTGVGIGYGGTSFGGFALAIDTIIDFIENLSTERGFHDFSEYINEMGSYQRTIDSIIKASAEIDINEKDYKKKFIEKTYHELSFQKQTKEYFRKRNKSK